MSNLGNEYKNSVAPALMTKFGYKSVMQIPKLDKVVINVGAGEAKDGIEYPRVTLSEEPAPDQYDPTMSEAEGSAFDEMMGDFNDFEGDDNYDDEF